MILPQNQVYVEMYRGFESDLLCQILPGSAQYCPESRIGLCYAGLFPLVPIAAQPQQVFSGVCLGYLSKQPAVRCEKVPPIA